MFYAFFVMIHAYSLVLFELLMAKFYLSFILSPQLDFTLVFFISSIPQEHTLEKNYNWWNLKTRPQEDYPQRGTGESWVSIRSSISSSSKS